MSQHTTVGRAADQDHRICQVTHDINTCFINICKLLQIIGEKGVIVDRKGSLQGMRSQLSHLCGRGPGMGVAQQRRRSSQRG